MKDLAAVGDVLAGKYRVDKILGIGGMGMVVAATHLELDQRVALKFMLPGSLGAADSSARFLREARAAGRLNSDHVCRVMDVGRFDSGAPYIVMEYLQGENLAAVLRRRGPLRVSEAVDYILQAIEGLAEAHAHGIIHRDLKPDNLFLAKRNDGGGIVKVLDFGISKVGIGVSTRTGDIMGSPAYMAPEQMESSRNVDQRADVWSLGVVLYQLVTGKPPFAGETLPLLCMHVVNDDPPSMAEIRGDLPDGFEAVVMKCLQKEPVDRYVDVGELATALAPFGPKHASTSASRIQIVLRRSRDSSVVIANEVPLVAPEAAAAAAEVAVRTQPPESTTFSATSGQSMATLRTGRAGWGTASLVIAGLGIAAMLVVALWRTGPGDLGHHGSSTSGAGASARPGPIVEPIDLEAGSGAGGSAATAVESPSPGAQAASAGSSAPSSAAPADSTTDSATDSTTEAAAAHAGSDAPRAAAPTRGKPTKASKKRPRRPRAGTAGTATGSASSDKPPDTSEERDPPEPEGEAEDDKWTHMTHDEKKP